jgi:hypothetical protein
MGVLKHSPTLIYAHSRSSSYLFFALAVSLAHPQMAASAPTSKTPKGQGAEQPGAIEQELNRPFLRLASSVSSHLAPFCPEELQAPVILCLLRPIPRCPTVTLVDWNGWCNSCKYVHANFVGQIHLQDTSLLQHLQYRDMLC